MIKLQIGDYVACKGSLEQLCTCGIVGTVTGINIDNNRLYLNFKVCQDGYNNIVTLIENGHFIYQSKIEQKFNKELKDILE